MTEQNLTKQKLFLAMQAQQRGDQKGAVAILEGLLRDTGDDPRTLWLLGRFRSAAGDRAGAAEAFRRATEADPDSERASIAYAMALPPEDRVDEVARFLERNPRAVHHLLLLGESGFVPDAIVASKKTWRVPPALAAHFAFDGPVQPAQRTALEATATALAASLGDRVRSTTLDAEGVAWLGVAPVEREAWPEAAIRHVCTAVEALAEGVKPAFLTVCPGLIRPDSLTAAVCRDMGMDPWERGLGLYDVDTLVEVFERFALNYELPAPSKPFAVVN